MLRMCLLLLHHTVTGFCSILSCPWRRRHSYTAFIVRGLWIVQTNLNKYVTFVNTRWTRIPFYTQKSVSTYVSIIRLRISEHIPLRICYEYVLVLTSPIATIYWYSVMLHSTQLAPRFYAISLLTVVHWISHQHVLKSVSTPKKSSWDPTWYVYLLLISQSRSLLFRISPEIAVLLLA